MRLQPSHWLVTGAAGIVAVGTAGAAMLAAQPPKYEGPKASHIHAIARRVEAPELGENLTPAPKAAPAVRLRAIVPPHGKDAQRVPKKPVAPTSSAAASQPTSLAATPETPAPSPQSIALMGITTEDGVDQAWLVNRENQERETAGPGETAFGFTVKDVQPEAVRLARGGEEFTVYLGPPPAPAAATTSTSPTQQPGSQPGPTQTAGAPPPQGGPQNQGFSQFGRRRGRRNSGSRAAGYRTSASSSRSRAYSRTRAQRTGSSSNASFSSNSGGFPWWLMGGSNNRNGALPQMPTPNAQTARRSGVQLLSDSEPLPELARIRNPQTRRRTGRSSGRAFGMTASGTYSYYSTNRRR